jgi:DNA excision repair protein ERCC-2
VEIDFDSKRVRMGIRDLVNYGQVRVPSSDRSAYGPWRMQLGQQWHNQLGEELVSEFGDQASLECTIDGTIEHEGWTFVISGRIDQVVTTDEWVELREIKTTQQVLPMASDELWHGYPDYFEQLACYELLWLIEASEKQVISNVIFLHVDTGIQQSVPLPDKAARVIEKRLRFWVDFLEQESRNKSRVAQYVVPAAFDAFREDQLPLRKQLLDGLERWAEQKNIIDALEAPTGFGKTSLVLEWSLQALKQRKIRRVLYLSGKNSGQLQVSKELARFQKKATDLRYLPVRNTDTHYQICPHLACPCQDRESDTSEFRGFLYSAIANELFENGNGTVEADKIGQCAQSQSMCPRIVSQHCLSHCETWVCDYNYVFAGGAEGVLDAVAGFHPKHSLLVIDEVHNLHERVAANLSRRLNSFHVERLLSEIQGFRDTRKLQGSISQLAGFVRNQKPCDEMDMAAVYLLKDILEELGSVMTEVIPHIKDLPRDVVDFLWELQDTPALVRRQDLEFLFWVDSHAAVNVSCIDASESIGKTIQSFNRTIVMSATLPPMESFSSQMGIPQKSIRPLVAESEWRRQAYSVVVDMRVNTSYKTRSQHYQTTAETIARMCFGAATPVLVFLPSYKYGEIVGEYMQVVAPEIRVFRMQQGTVSNEQIERIEEAMLTSDALLLPLGGSLSEGIDILGGRVDRVMVVGPALPEVNAIQKAKSSRYSSRTDAFRNVYLIPGITKVNQALGRIVRDPMHRAKVLLHCKRFAQPDYHELLASEYQNARQIRSNEQLEAWVLGDG